MDTHITTEMSFGDYDPDEISQKAKDKLRVEIQQGTLDPMYVPMRFGNSQGFASLEKSEELPHMGMNALIFSSKFI